MKKLSLFLAILSMFVLSVGIIACETKSNNGNSVVDTTAPIISEITASNITQNSATIPWSTDELATSNLVYGLTTSYGSSAPVSVDITADTTSHSVVIGGLTPNTAYHYQVKSADASGNLATSIDYTFSTLADDTDTTPPTATLSSTSISPTKTSPIPVTATFSEAVTGFVVGDITVGNGTVDSFVAVSTTVYTFNVTPTAQGAVTVDIAAGVAQDAATNGNTAATQLSITYDTVAPSVTVTSPNGGEAWIGGSSHAITWTASDTNMASSPITLEYYNGTAWVSVATGEANDCTYTWTVPTINISTAKVRVTAVDSAGNSAFDESNATFTIDSTLPSVTLSSTSASPTNASPMAVTATFSEAVTGFVIGDVTVGHGTAGSFVVVSTTVYTFNVTPTAQGAVTIDIAAGVAQDAALNNNTAATQLSITYDSVAPVISSVVSSNITTTSASITWTTDELATSNLVYGLTTSYGSSSPLPADTTADKTSHSVVISGLYPNTAYHYQVRSKDAVGNEAVSDENTLLTSKTVVEVSGLISTDTIWSSNYNYRLIENLGIEKGATLTIEPGTLVERTPDINASFKIQVGGTLLAEGTPEKPIMFTPNSGMEGIQILSTSGKTSVIKYCLIENANTGIKIMDGAEPLIQNNTIKDCITGIDIAPSSFTLSYNYISNCRYGIKVLQEAILYRNTITSNEWGICAYVVSALPNIMVIENNIYDNLYLNFASWGSHSGTIDATNNWWGTTEEALIQEKIFDYYDDIARAKVLYLPFATTSILEAP